MTSFARLLICSAVFAWLPLAALARQDSSDRNTLEFRTRQVQNGRLDLDSGIRRAMYRIEGTLAVREPDRFIELGAERFGWRSDGGDLVLKERVKREASTHITYQQTYAGIPVDRRTVRVNLDRTGRVSMVLSAYEPLEKNPGFRADPAVSADQATTRALQAISAEGSASSQPELVVHPGVTPRLAWRLFVWPTHETAEYRVLVDARSGEIILAVDQSVHDRFSVHEEADRIPFVSPEILPGQSVEGGQLDGIAPGLQPGFQRNPDPVRSFSSNETASGITRVDGTGFAYVPDPLFTAGVPYGGSYIDQNDQTNSVLDAERREVPLRQISLNGQGKWVLNGPYVDIIATNSGGSTVYVPPAESSPDGFHYSRDNDGFESVNTYYHIDASQRYVQSLGFLDRQNGPIGVSPQGMAQDDSRYFPGQNRIYLGIGAVDDAEDATVIWHEYAHALLEAVTPGLVGAGRESLALHEGWSDYWAASYLRYLVETGQTTRTDWRRIFAWDSGDGTLWPGRTMDFSGRYPEDTCSDNSGGGACSVHNDGRLWATVLLAVQDDLGRAVTDELVLLSHMYLSVPVTFPDAAEAVLQADADYFNGAHFPVLLEAFDAAGLTDPDGYAPVMEHAPLSNTADAGGSRPVSVQVIPTTSSVSEVTLFWASPSLGDNQASMSMASGGQYEAIMDLPSETETVEYWFEAEDVDGRIGRLPATPGEVFSFILVIGDLDPPVITHEPISEVALADWPPIVSTTITDILGVQQVRVSYELFNADGGLREDGSFSLANSSGNTWSGTFPMPLDAVERQSTVRYRIHAEDLSKPPNEAIFPEDDESIVFQIRAEGLLRAFGFESTDEGITREGDWETGQPPVNARRAYAGQSVAATGLATPYTAAAGEFRLILPAINLKEIPDPRITFRHHFDLEHDGSVDPTQGGGQIRDGAMILTRSAARPDWTPLDLGGFATGPIASGNGNPRGGTGAFGGYSYGWRFAALDLPSEDSLEVAFVLATDQGNQGVARSFGGWVLDDVRITTELPTDAAPPQLVGEQSVRQVLSTQVKSVSYSVRASDDLGVVDAFLDYSVHSGGTTETGTVRLDMDASDFLRFASTLNLIPDPSPRDRIEYEIRLQDTAGHVLRADGEGDGYVIEYRLIASKGLTSNAVTSGAWTTSTVGWITSTSPETVLSSLNLSPSELPGNAIVRRLELDHAYRFFSRRSGNVKISTNGGASWQVLIPDGGYQDTVDIPGHLMEGEPVFQGDVSQAHTTRFDLDAIPVSTALIRLDVAEPFDHDTGLEFWSVNDVRFVYETELEEFDFDRRFELLPVYPNPFRSRANLAFTIPEASDVDLLVFDAMGRQVASLVDGHLPAGSHATTLDAAGLSSGAYIVQLRAGGKSESRTIVLIR